MLYNEYDEEGKVEDEEKKEEADEEGKNDEA